MASMQVDYSLDVFLLIILGDGHVLTTGFQLVRLKLSKSLVFHTETVVYHLGYVVFPAGKKSSFSFFSSISPGIDYLFS